jgi:hypothetical protein
MNQSYGRLVSPPPSRRPSWFLPVTGNLCLVVYRLCCILAALVDSLSQ